MPAATVDSMQYFRQYPLNRWWPIFCYCALLAIPFQTIKGQGADFWSSPAERQRFNDLGWVYGMRDFSGEAYRQAIGELFTDFESRTGKGLAPGAERRVGIKVYTNSGVGLATPRPLVRAVIEALEQRGFARDEMFLIDLREIYLREAGFLPPLAERSRGPTFEGVPVYALESGDWFDPVWYYESPLPSEVPSRWGGIGNTGLSPESDEERRKSFLPAPLLTGVDFWINLPMGLSDDALGVSGALANATVWNISNRQRFFVSPVNGPVAVAEIAAIPELVSNWALTILTLERYQFIGGPAFNSLYTASEARLLMSTNPVILDRILLGRINRLRREKGFEPSDGSPAVLRFSEDLGLGSADPNQVEFIPMGREVFMPNDSS